MNESIKQALALSIAQSTPLAPEQILALLEKPKNEAYGDVALPCFQLAKPWGLPPPKCAQKLSSEMILPPSVAKATVVGPFLNFYFERAAYTNETIKAILATTNFTPAAADPQPVVIDYSSPNIAKPFHVGHLRATLIGNSLDRIFRFQGKEVVSINHLGDWGTQFGFVWAGCKLWGTPTGNKLVGQLVELYKRSTALKARQEKNETTVEDAAYPPVNDIARQFFIDLEAGVDYAVNFWKWCLEISLEYFKDTYARIGVHFDHYTGESFYSDKLDSARDALEKKGILVESDGAWGVELGEELGFARILTPDGRSLYLTRDIATAIYRKETFDFGKALYVVGAPQTLHFSQLKAVLAKAGMTFESDMVHVPFGMVLGMKTRGSGEIVELNDFIDEAIERALTAYREQVSKRPEGLDEAEVATGVALAAIIFSTLSRQRMKDVVFDWNQALQFQGDTGPYILYAYARINGIKEKAQEMGITPQNTIDPSLITEDSLYQLTLLLSEFSAAMERAVRDYEPAYIANYALDVARAFSAAYISAKVIGSEASLAEARLTLFEATRIVLGHSLSLLGIPALSRM